MITLQNVSKYFETQAILRNISFTIDKGEMFYITGPSGAGKSTLLKLIYLAETPDEGELTIGDYHISFWNDRRGWRVKAETPDELKPLKVHDIPFLRRNIGIVFQDFKLISTLSVFDNVALALRIRNERESEIKSHVFDALKRVYLRHKANAFPKTLSGGEQQRAAIARAIVTMPQIVLADEPTGNLDPDTATGIMMLFKEINLQGTTVVIATHNRELFKNSGRRVVRLDSGNVIAEEVSA